MFTTRFSFSVFSEHYWVGIVHYQEYVEQYRLRVYQPIYLTPIFQNGVVNYSNETYATFKYLEKLPKMVLNNN